MNSLSRVLEYFSAFSMGDWLRHITSEQTFTSLRASLLILDDRIWYFLSTCALLAFVSRIALEIMVPSEPFPAKDETARQLQSTTGATLQTTLPQSKPSETLAAGVTALDAMRQRLRVLELECDTLRAEAQRSSRLEAELAAANMRVEELSHIVSSSRAASSPRTLPTPAASALAATPIASTPLKILHRTPSSAATKSLTVRSSLLQKGQGTPTFTPSQLC
jgi:hypothetical protein